MLEIRIEGVALFDGAFQLDVERPFRNSEWRLIKKISDVRMGEFQDAIEAGDNDVIVALAVIALIRAGRIQKNLALRAGDELMDAEFGAITLTDLDQPDPPAAPPIGGSESEQPTDPAENSRSSSPDSSSTGDILLVTTPSSTGTPDSDTGATSAPETSAT